MDSQQVCNPSRQVLVSPVRTRSHAHADCTMQVCHQVSFTPTRCASLRTSRPRLAFYQRACQLEQKSPHQLAHVQESAGGPHGPHDSLCSPEPYTAIQHQQLLMRHGFQTSPHCSAWAPVSLWLFVWFITGCSQETRRLLQLQHLLCNHCHPWAQPRQMSGLKGVSRAALCMICATILDHLS